MIIRKPSFNQMGSILSTFYLCMKYLLSDGKVCIIQGDQDISRKCYVECLKLKKVRIVGVNIMGAKENLSVEALEEIGHVAPKEANMKPREEDILPRSLELKKVITLSVNIMDAKVDPLGEAHEEEGFVVPEAVNVKVVENDLSPRSFSQDYGSHLV